MPFGSTFILIGKIGHQLEGCDMGKHAEDIILALLNRIDKEYL